MFLTCKTRKPHTHTRTHTHTSVCIHHHIHDAQLKIKHSLRPAFLFQHPLTRVCVHGGRGRAVAVPVGGDHRHVVDLSTAESCQVAVVLPHGLAAAGAAGGVLYVGPVGVGAGALAPAHRQLVVPAVHMGGEVGRGARHCGRGGQRETH